MSKKPSINSKQKGARFERAIANWLKQNGFDARRGQQFKGTPDSPDVESEIPFHIECKHVEALNIHKAMDQAAREAPDDRPPVVIHKKNHKETLVTMRADDWLNLVIESLEDANTLESLADAAARVF